LASECILEKLVGVGNCINGTNYGIRYYDPAVGRFISVVPTGFNRYTYVRNNPVKYIDPTGYDFGKYWNLLIYAN